MDIQITTNGTAAGHSCQQETATGLGHGRLRDIDTFAAAPGLLHALTVVEPACIAVVADRRPKGNSRRAPTCVLVQTGFDVSIVVTRKVGHATSFDEMERNHGPCKAARCPIDELMHVLVFRPVPNSLVFMHENPPDPATQRKGSRAFTVVTTATRSNARQLSILLLCGARGAPARSGSCMTVP